MTASDGHDDGDAEDPKLRQLRAVWIAMRDEAPPERGLVALMAAARAQASAMNRPATWWQRVLGALRTPPVLGFATVVVLLGGAIVIAQRPDSMRSERTVSSAAELSERADAVHVVTPPRLARGDLAQEGQAHERQTREATASDEGAMEAPMPTARGPIDHANSGSGASSRSATGQPAPKPAKLRRSQEPAAEPTEKASRFDASSRDGGTMKNEEPGGRISSAPVTQPTGGLAIARAEDGASSIAGARAKVANEASAKDAPEATPPAGASRSEEDPAHVASVERAIKQCEEAAARGDCSAVRALAARIARSSPSAYKDRVVKNVAVARCLN